MAIATANITAQQAEIIRRYKQHVTKRELGQRGAARELQCSTSTVSQMFAGKYTGNAGRYIDRMGRVLEKAAYRRVMPQRPEYAETSVAERVREAMTTALIERALVFVEGGTGVGKTTTVRQFARAEDDIIYIEAGPGAGPAAVLKMLAAELGVETRGTQHGLRRRIVDELSGADLVIVVDEVDYMHEGAIQHLRLIHDNAEIGMVWVGTPAFLGKLRSRKSATVNQVLGRVAHRVDVGAINRDDVAMLGKTYDLDDEALDALAQGSAGQARRVVHALAVCHRNGWKVDAEHILRAFRELMPVLGE